MGARSHQMSIRSTVISSDRGAFLANELASDQSVFCDMRNARRVGAERTEMEVGWLGPLTGGRDFCQFRARTARSKLLMLPLKSKSPREKSCVELPKCVARM